MESDVEGFKGISDSLSVGSATLTVARNASETVTKLLTEMKGKIVAAQAENVDRSKIQTDIDALTKQIELTVGAAQFNGLNLVDGSQTTVNVLSSLDRSQTGVTSSNITVDAQNLSTSAGAALTAGGGTVGGVTTLVRRRLRRQRHPGHAGRLCLPGRCRRRWRRPTPTADPADLTELIAGDKISLKIGSVEGSYVVQKGDTGDALVAGLKASLTTNGLSDTDFTLTLNAGELEVTNNTNVDAAISASATRGTGGLVRAEHHRRRQRSGYCAAGHRRHAADLDRRGGIVRLLAEADRHPERVRGQAVRLAEDRHRRHGRHRHGGSLGPTAGAAGAAAARDPGAVDRQPAAAGSPVSVPLSTSGRGG